MLAKYPGRSELTVVILPLAKEVFASFGNIPIKTAELAKECEAYRRKFGFKKFDLSLLKNDDLWYIRQLELADSKL